MTEVEQSSELSDARKIFMAELDNLRRENAKLYERVFQLKQEIRDRDQDIASLRERLRAKEAKTTGKPELDNHSEAGPL